MITFFQKHGLAIGIATTAFVVGLLIFLHVFGKPETERLHLGFVPQGIILDISAPVEVHQNLIIANEHLSKIGYALPGTAGAPYIVRDASRMETCQTLIRGEMAYIPCKPGWVVVALWDQKMISREGEAGKANWDGDAPTWCTILVPARVEDTVPTDLPIDVKLPDEADAILLAHEFLHCRGVGHVFTEIIGPFHSIPSGSIMHPNTLESGWGVEGL